MTVIDPRHRPLRNRSLLMLGWGLVMAAAVTLTAAVERNQLLSEFGDEVAALHRLLSQRADQHDAHMTALSALATADGGSRPDLFLEVAATIARFYPRIAAVDLVTLADPRAHLTTRSALSDDQFDTVRAAALASDGRLELRQTPGRPGSYLLVKRSPNADDARFGLAFEVDGAALLETDSAFWTRPSVSRTLLLPDGTRLAGDNPVALPRFEKALGSKSQPLLLRADIAPRIADLLPAGPLAAIAVLTSLVYLGLVLGLGQLARARRAERQAHLSAQEARLAHASRVNALGEMASGMAHELTQPLTAILSQAQAGRHLCKRGNADALEPVMQGIADQAKRASAILERLRSWTRPTPSTDRTGQIVQALQSVELLLGSEAGRNGVSLNFTTGPHPLPVNGDQVELEQIVFNLVRNAIEAASSAPPGNVTVVAERSGDHAVVDVGDSGPGVPATLRDRLFEPFVTGKPEGTGLGLALCQRLAERMGGEVTLLDGRSTVFRLRLPLRSGQAREART